MDQYINELYKDVPEIIHGAIEMKEANASILIFEGIFFLKHKEFEIEINGTISYEWFPNPGVIFSGETKLDSHLLYAAFQNEDTFNLNFKDLNFSDCILSGFSLASENNSSLLSGIISNLAIAGDTSVVVSHIIFSIPNLRDFHGIPVKTTTINKLSSSKSRLIFENDIYSIIIDKCKSYKDLQSSLETKGGFIIQYVGELRKKKGSISFEESKEIINCLDTFLSFLNGRQTSVHFSKGIFDKEVIWTDYTNYTVESFKWVLSWPTRRSIEGFSEMWTKFSKMWCDENDKNFLISAIQWYIQANSRSLVTEGLIIMAQTGLELIYNYLLIEQNKLIIGDDAQNIAAANKIRLLLSHLNVSTEIPKSFTHLKDIPDIIDAPDVFVQIRNAIVHSQEKKRKKLSNIHPLSNHEALQLGIWYIELSLLKILNYNGLYHNRSIREKYPSKCEQIVPWVKIENK